MRFAFLLMIVLCLTVHAHADVQASAPAESMSAFPASMGLIEQPTTFGLAGRLATGLLLCLGVFTIGLQVHRKITGDKPLSNRRMKLVERLSLTQKSSLALVEIDGRTIILSLGAEAARVVSTPTDEELEMKFAMEMAPIEHAKAV